MHRFPSDSLSIWLRGCMWEASEQSTTLREVLKAKAKESNSAINEGLALIGTASDGSSVNYAAPSMGAGMSITPETKNMMMGRLWDWVDEIVAETPSITDEALVAAIKLRNKPINGLRHNFSHASG